MKKVVAVAILVILGLRLAVLAGAHLAAEDLIRGIAGDGRLLAATLNLELGGFGGRESQRETDDIQTIKERETHPAEVTLPEADQVFFRGEPAEESQEPQKNDPLKILPTTISGGLTIDNSTSYEPDIQALMSQGLGLRLAEGEPQILIIHTHGSEAYTPDAIDTYVPTDVSRTEDKEFNVIRIGDELTAALEGQGLCVIHDREIYDYPSYTGSYLRSEAAIESHLAQHPSISVVLDIHRDAIGSEDVVYKTMAEVGGEPSAQVMLLVATGENGLPHPRWEENLNLALHLQAAMTGKYPTLARPVALKSERYNQHLTTGSLIIEVGSSGNTLREAITAIRLFADSVSDTLLQLVESPAVDEAADGSA